MKDLLSQLQLKLIDCLNNYYETDCRTFMNIEYILLQIRNYVLSEQRCFDDLSQALHSFLQEEIPVRNLSSSTKYLYARITSLMISINNNEDVSEWSYQRHHKIYKLSEENEQILNCYSQSMSDISESSRRTYLYNSRFFLYEIELRNIDHISNVTAETAYEIIRCYTERSKSFPRHMLRFIRFLGESDICPELNDICFDKPKADPKEYNKLTFSPEELQGILNAADRSNPVGKRNYAIMQIAVQTLLRSVDIASIKISDIDFSRNQIALIQAKNKTPVVSEVNDECMKAIADYIDNGRPETDDDHLFIRARRPYRAICRKGTIQNIFKSLRDAAGIDHVDGDGRTMHGIRRSVISQMAANNEDIGIIAEALGHQSINTSIIYTSLDPRQLQDCSLSLENIEITKGEYLDD